MKHPFRLRGLAALLILLLLAASLLSCAVSEAFMEGFLEGYSGSIESEGASENDPASGTDPSPASSSEASLDPDGSYSSRDEVALYLHLYGHLPKNFITKKTAEKEYHWIGGGLPDGLSIGGDYFGNYEGALPKAKDREYHECDIDTANKKERGEKRIIYSNDGLIYYTDDHYESFTLLYGDPHK